VKNQLLYFWLFYLLLGCTNNRNDLSGICLSFDDRNLEQWVGILPLLAENDARVTFFLSGIMELSENDKLIIKKIQKAGHEIQSHGNKHVEMNKYIAENGIWVYLEKEINEQLKAFEEIGTKPTVFAYPFGEKNRYIDLFLWRKFSATRNVALPKKNLEKVDEIFYKIGESRFNYFSLGIDQVENITESQLEKALQRAKRNKEIVLMHAHEIGENGNYQISEEKLKWLLEHSKILRLKFLTYSDLIQS
jgi:peptidoglycan/xylan/chitin deacetylase (PgdA/CDA1 family)